MGFPTLIAAFLLPCLKLGRERTAVSGKVSKEKPCQSFPALPLSEASPIIVVEETMSLVGQKNEHLVQMHMQPDSAAGAPVFFWQHATAWCCSWQTGCDCQSPELVPQTQDRRICSALGAAVLPAPAFLPGPIPWG